MASSQQSAVEDDPVVPTPASRFGALRGFVLEWVYRMSVQLGFAQLLSGIVIVAIVIAIALAIPIWGGLYGVPAGQAIVVTFLVALLTATPLAWFLVFVIKKAENTRAALESSNADLKRERETQQETFKDLRIARDEAYAANEAKTQFLANMSHELRTPLNAVIGFSEIIAKEMRGPVGKSEYLGYAQSINESGAHLLALIDDILDVARIEAGGYRLNEETGDLGTCAASALQLIAARAKAARVELRNEVPADLPLLRCDLRAVKQMLLNLLTNAVSFTPAGGVVSLSAHERPQGGLCLAVADTGVGMSEEEIPFALARFSQVDSSHSREHHGAGLGLPLTRDLVELHGGELTIGSRPDHGTTVTLRFPPERTEKRPEAGTEI